jgi:hypothetical protein
VATQKIRRLFLQRRVQEIGNHNRGTQSGDTILILSLAPPWMHSLVKI